MHNPARQEQAVKRARLDRISHHFLTDRGAESDQAIVPTLLPLLCCNGDASQALRLLQQVLQGHGEETRIMAADQVDWQAAREQALPAEPDSELRRRYRLHLVMLNDEQSNTTPPPATLALVVPARAQGLTAAYTRLQEYAYARQVPRIGVIFTDSVGPRSGWCYFRKLAIMSRRTLRLPLVNLGYLPPTPSTEEAGSLMVASRIVHNRFFLPYRSTDLGSVG